MQEYGVDAKDGRAPLFHHWHLYICKVLVGEGLYEKGEGATSILQMRKMHVETFGMQAL